jgi:hypothetical protein
MGNEMAKKITRIRPWTKEEARMLKSLAREKTKTTVIARKLKRSVDAMYGLVSKWGREIEGGRDVIVKREVVPEDERASEGCLHCEINDLVQEHVEGQESVDAVALAANIAESLVDLILLAPEEDHATLMATAIAHLGHAFLEKSGVTEGKSGTTH